MLQQAEEQNPFFAPVQCAFGYLTFRTEEFHRAQGYFRRSIALDSDFLPAYFNLGFLEYQNGRKENAAYWWRQYRHKGGNPQLVQQTEELMK